MCAAVFLSAVLFAQAFTYDVKVVSVSSDPVLSYVRGNSQYNQIFNPSYVVASPATGGVEGLVARTQNCSAKVGGGCVYCSGQGPEASILTFSAMRGGVPSPVNSSSVIFRPDPGNTLEVYGTEDPRILYDPEAKLYYMFYTCYGTASSSSSPDARAESQPRSHTTVPASVLLCLAVAENPLEPSSWTRMGPVFPNIQGSKSAALLLRNPGPHYLFWGAGSIHVAKSYNPLVWPDPGSLFIDTRESMFDSAGVESGPPPLLLSTGDYLFIYNSWDKGWPKSTDPNSGYHPAFVILNGSNPEQILQRADAPFLLPSAPWEQGLPPYTCNVPRVLFLEAAVATENEDEFVVYYGGSDAVVGQAVIKVTHT